MALETRGSLSKKNSGGRLNRVQTEGERLAHEWGRTRRGEREVNVDRKMGHKDESIEEARTAAGISLW